jgi:hypothetical protein
LSISTLLTSFLPFSIPISQTTPVGDKTPVPSHAPLPNKPELLGLFSPLEISCSISPPSKPSNASSPIIQLHTISLSSPNGLLNARLGLTITSTAEEISTPTVSNLHIQHISLWAKREIGSSLETRAKTGDIASIGYSLGRYWEISLKRAQCWAKLCQQFPQLIRDVEYITDKDAAQGRKRKREAYSQDEIRRHLGRNSVTFKDGYAELRISWVISLDWSGEVESRVSSRASFPIICMFHSDRGKLLILIVIQGVKLMIDPR